MVEVPKNFFFMEILFYSNVVDNIQFTVWIIHNFIYTDIKYASLCKNIFWATRDINDTVENILLIKLRNHNY